MAQLNQAVYRCGEFLIETTNRRFSRGGVELMIEPRAFAVAVQLMSRSGELVSRDQLLDAVWGHRFVTPSTLNRVIALVRRAFGDDIDNPKYVQTVHGAGYRFIGPIAPATAALEERVQARFGPPPAARLPAPLESLIGRSSELGKLAAMLSDGRAVTIVGSGGMGKTQCALAFAHQQANEYPDGVWFFDLVALQRAEQWLELLGLALSMPPAAERHLLERVAEAFAGRDALLVVDNCDRLSGGVGKIAVDLLRATDRLKLLATSQQPLSFLGERLLRMPPLALPEIRRPAAQDEIMEIAAAPAVALLLARIRSIQPGFAIVEDNAPAIVEICERLDGMPLALELAAARFALLSPAQVLERLAQRFRFLASDVAGRDERHRNLASLLDWSFSLLSPGEQQLLTWLGVFVQGWTVEAAIFVAAGIGHDPESAVELLTGLANKSLVAVDQSLNPPRYRLLESVRDFALARLAESGEEQRARGAHLAYIRRMAEDAHRDMVGGRMRERIGALLHENGNIETAADYALGAGADPQSALQIAGSLMLYFKAHGSNLVGLGLCERVLRTAPPDRTKARALALMSRGVNGVMLQKIGPDAALLEAVSIARETDDEWAIAYASGFYALWLANAGRPGEAPPHATITEQIAQRLRDGILQGLAGLTRGWMYMAGDQIEQALVVLRSVRNVGGDLHQHHFIDMYIGLSLFRNGDLAAAASQWREAMRNALAVGHVRGAAGCIEGCGYIAERLGQLERACLCLGSAEQIRNRTGIPLFNFWIPHHDHAHESARATLGAGGYTAALRRGAARREEDAINESAQWLQDFARLAPGP